MNGTTHVGVDAYLEGDERDDGYKCEQFHIGVWGLYRARYERESIKSLSGETLGVKYKYWRTYFIRRKIY